MFVDRYMDAKENQNEKSKIVELVMDVIKENCPKDGAFVKYKDGKWWTVDERTAREKVGARFRDCLAGSYKSSSKSKLARRKHNTEQR